MSPIVTLVLQVAVALLLVVFGVGATVAARAMGTPGMHRESWRVTGILFVVYAAINLVQVTFATAAYFAGPGTALYDGYLAAAPSGNHVRTLLLPVLYVTLGVIALRRTVGGSRLLGLWAGIATAVVAGALYGQYEGSLEAARHFSATAVLDAAGFLLLGGALILAIQRDSMDRLLWACLAIHGFRIILGVLYHTGLAWFGVPGGWAPPAWQMHTVRVVLIGAQIALVLHRIRLARRGVPVQGLAPTGRTTRISLA